MKFEVAAARPKHIRIKLLLAVPSAAELILKTSVASSQSVAFMTAEIRATLQHVELLWRSPSVIHMDQITKTF